MGKSSRKRSRDAGKDAAFDLTLVNGYKCLPILKHIVTSGNSSEEDVVKIRSCIYYRRHFGKRLKQSPSDNSNGTQTLEVDGGGKTTIFVANLCPRMDEASVKQLFSLDGKLEVVDVGIGFLNNALPPVKYAHVAFKSEEDTDIIMGLQADHLEKKPLLLSAVNEGYEQWLEESQNVPTLTSLRKDADIYMEAFQKRLDDERKERERRMQEADDDGFTVVKRSKQARLSGQNATNIVPRGRKKKKSKELKDFYRFQLKEGKRDKLAELRTQFEADKKKVERLKLTKKFKGV
eukprot:g3809.t1